jgi:hypothetical protein
MLHYSNDCLLQLVAPENAPLKEVEEEYIFLEEKKNHVE